jgi:hypothetical protein
VLVHRLYHYTLSATQLHSDLVKTTILKDFVEFEGISKCVSYLSSGYSRTQLIDSIADSATSPTAVRLLSFASVSY